MKISDVTKEYIRYVSRNILAMLGISCYILADTFFISTAAGTNGMAALNLVLPVYNVINGIGAMTGMGAATMFSLEKAAGRNEPKYFTGAMTFAIMASIIFMAAGAFFPEKVMLLMGGNSETIAAGKDYTRIFMLFAPFFMLNHIVGAFVRNDGRPSLSMGATLAGSFSNILLDYIFMFPLKMGMKGAALATGLSPVISLLICSEHFLSGKSSVKFRLSLPSPGRITASCKVGVSALMGEMSSCVTTLCFNLLVLRYAGNVGVAAYGVIANYALVTTAVFNGIFQGSQPLISRFYGANDKTSAAKVLRLAVVTAEIAAAVSFSSVLLFAPQLAALFNSEKSPEMAAYAIVGIHLYFIGFFFAGFNIIASGFFGASANALPAAVISVMRGFIAITAMAFTLSYLFGLTGIWLAFPASELITAAFAVFFIIRRKIFSTKPNT